MKETTGDAKNTLFKRSFIFLIGGVVNKSIPFFMLPILTRYLSTSEYGLITTFQAAIGIFLAFVSLSANSAINIYFFKLNRDEHKKLVFNALLLSSLFYLATTCTIYILQIPISDILGLPVKWVLYLTTYAYFHTIIESLLSLYKSRQQAIHFAAFEIFRTIINFSLSIYLIFNMSLAWEGRLSGLILSTALMASIAITIILKNQWISFTVSKQYIKTVFNYGYPLIPHIIAGWVITSSDRFFINKYASLSETGLYSVGYQVSLALGIILLSFNNAWQPYIFEKLKHFGVDQKINIIKFTYLYFVVTILASIALYFISPIILSYITTSAYSEAHSYILYLAPSTAFNGMYYMVSVYIFYTTKTRYITTCTMFGAILNIVLNFLLIKQFGAIGAAQATLISYMTIFLLAWIMAYRLVPMPWFSFWKKY